MNYAGVAAAVIAIVSTTTTRDQGRHEETKPVLYHDASKGSPALNREAKKAYEGKFRLTEATAKDGFYGGGMKGLITSSIRFRDPRSMRDAEIPGKVSFVFIVTTEGRVVEPRILHSTDAQVSKYIIEQISYDRYFPGRFRGTPVYSLHVGEWKFGGPDESTKASGDGLGIYRSRDR